MTVHINISLPKDIVTVGKERVTNAKEQGIVRFVSMLKSLIIPLLRQSRFLNQLLLVFYILT